MTSLTIHAMQATTNVLYKSFGSIKRIGHRTLLFSTSDNATNYHDLEKAIATSQRATRDWVKVGDYEKALSSGEETLKKIVSHFGVKHPVHASALNDLGLIHKCLGEFDTAISTYEKALEVYEDALGTQEHASYGTTLTNLGHVYRAQATASKGLKSMEWIDNAWLAFKRASEIRSKVLDRNHPDQAMSMVNLGTTSFHRGRTPEAIRYLRQAVVTLEENIGQDHLMTATSRNNLAFVLKCDKQYEEAIALYQNVYEIRRNKLGPGHHETITVMHNLSEAFRASGDEPSSVKLQSEILKIMQPTNV